LNHEASKIGDEIDKIMQQGKAILPTVSEADKLTLSEQLNGMKDKHGRISAIIRDRSDALKDQIKNCREAAAKVEECVHFMSEIQKELKELNRPVGSKVEDVQGMLASYEVCKSFENAYSALEIDLNTSKKFKSQLHVYNPKT
jgi:nesprin-1